MSELTYNVILIVAVIASILPPLLLIINKAIRAKNCNKKNVHKMKIEGKSGVIIELDLHKQNDIKKIHQTIEILLGK